MKLSEALAELSHPVAYYPQIARFLGSVSAAVLFAQLAYWAGEGETSKTESEIEEHTGLTRWMQETARRRLTSRGYLSATRRRDGIAYRILWDAVNADWEMWKSCGKLPECGNTTIQNVGTPQSRMWKHHNLECGNTTIQTCPLSGQATQNQGDTNPKTPIENNIEKEYIKEYIGEHKGSPRKRKYSPEEKEGILAACQWFAARYRAHTGVDISPPTRFPHPRIARAALAVWRMMSESPDKQTELSAMLDFSFTFRYITPPGDIAEFLAMLPRLRALYARERKQLPRQAPKTQSTLSETGNRKYDRCEKAETCEGSAHPECEGCLMYYRVPPRPRPSYGPVAIGELLKAFDAVAGGGDNGVQT